MKEKFLKTVQLSLLVLFASLLSGFDYSGPSCDMEMRNCTGHGAIGQKLCCCPAQGEIVDTSGEIEATEYLAEYQKVTSHLTSYFTRPVFYKKQVYSSFYDPLKTIRLLM